MRKVRKKVGNDDEQNGSQHLVNKCPRKPEYSEYYHDIQVGIKVLKAKLIQKNRTCKF